MKMPYVMGALTLVKRIFPFIGLCTTLALGAAHARDPLRTCGYLNGRSWHTMGSIDRSDLSRNSYLMGVMDMGSFRQNPQGDIWPKGATVGDVNQGLNQFYADPANLQIPIPGAISIIKTRFEGGDPKVTEEFVRISRKWASDTCQEK